MSNRFLFLFFVIVLANLTVLGSAEADFLSKLDGNGNTYVKITVNYEDFSGDIGDVSVYTGKKCEQNITEYISFVRPPWSHLFQIDNRLITDFTRLCVQAGKYSKKDAGIAKGRLNNIQLE